MKPQTVLPDSYHPIGSLDLSSNLRALIWLNVIGALLLVVAGWLSVRAAYWLRPAEAGGQIQIRINGLPDGAWMILLVLAVTVVMLVVHEAFHGLFFWLFTRSRPVFGLGVGYAYAAAPGWYLPKWQYFITSLAPLVGITILGLLLLAYGPASWMMPSAALIAFNASGAVGDLAVAAWLLSQPADCLANDRGDAVTLYLQKSNS
jgi:hypothetical protein